MENEVKKMMAWEKNNERYTRFGYFKRRTEDEDERRDKKNQYRKEETTI